MDAHCEVSLEELMEMPELIDDMRKAAEVLEAIATGAVTVETVAKAGAIRKGLFMAPVEDALAIVAGAYGDPAWAGEYAKDNLTQELGTL